MRARIRGLHSEYDLDEFTFRFNRRRADHRGLLFFRLLQTATMIDPTTYRQMVKSVRGLKPSNHKREWLRHRNGYPSYRDWCD